MIVLAAALLAAASCAVPPAEISVQHTLGYDAFDRRTEPYGWRALNASGCTDAALGLLAAYLAANKSRLSGEQQRELAFHQGQTLAFAGREPESLAYFESASSKDAASEWQLYVAATIAFVEHDMAALAAARASYARVAPDSMRLRVIDGFVACPDQPYAKAAHCRM